MSAPPRLLDDPSTPPELRKDLLRSASNDPSYDVAAGLAAFSAAIASGAGGGASTAAAASASGAGKVGATLKAGGVLGSLSVKASLAAVGTAAVIAAGVASLPTRSAPKKPAPAVQALHSQTARARGPQPSPIASTADAVEAPSTQAIAQPAVPAEPAQAESSRAALVAPERPSARVGFAAPARSLEPTPSLRVSSEKASSRREIAQLARIKQLLDPNPSAALRLAEAGNREFGTGILREEREGLLVLALWKLGREQVAREKTRAFLSRYPRSGLCAQLSALLQQKAE